MRKLWIKLKYALDLNDPQKFKSLLIGLGVTLVVLAIVFFALQGRNASQQAEIQQDLNGTGAVTGKPQETIDYFKDYAEENKDADEQVKNFLNEIGD